MKENIHELNYNIKTKMAAIDEELKELEKDPVMISYRYLTSSYEKLNQELQKIKEIIKENCSHPLWILLDDRTDVQTNWKCQCLKCGKIKIDSPEVFIDSVIGSFNKVDVQTAIDEFNHLENQNMSDEEITKKLIKKYNK